MIGDETSHGALGALLPEARLVEVAGRNVAATPEDAWQLVRHGDLGDILIARLLFGLRTLPARLAGHAPGPPRLRIDQMVSRPDAPGFTILVDDPPHEVVVGGAGAVWRREIPFVHIITPVTSPRRRPPTGSVSPGPYACSADRAEARGSRWRSAWIRAARMHGAASGATSR